MGKSTPRWLWYSSGFVVDTVSLSILLVLYLLLSLNLFSRSLIKMSKNVSHLVQVCILPMLHGQAQLSLSRGGLGLRSLPHHAPAAYIASLCFSGLGNSYVHLLQAIEMFSSLEKCHPQKTLSNMLDSQLFNVLLSTHFIADRACLLLASSSHASSWLKIIPSKGQVCT